jgi:SAM-dependent methyltransferase
MPCFGSGKLALLLWVLIVGSSHAFVPQKIRRASTQAGAAEVRPKKPNGFQSPAFTTSLRMAMDPVTYLRTEFIAASLCSNQTPRAADVCLQLGTQDGRVVSFIPRTVRELITSSAEADGKLSARVRRQLKQSEDRRGAAKVTYVDQPADDLRETKDESVDVVISMLAVEVMMENKLDWKKSVREAARVLKPGGRLLWVEPAEIDGEFYVDYIQNLVAITVQEGDVVEDGDEVERFPLFDDVGFDEVDLVLQPHVAGVAVKSMDAGMTPDERAQKTKLEEEEKLAEITIQAYERGIKKKRKKKKKVKTGADALAE